MAISHYYVDPSINADSGAGTLGDPYGDLQHCLDTITRNSSDGDQININDTGTETLTASLDLSTYGTPTALARLTLRGYTSAANDGGEATIDGDGNTLFASDYDYITLMDLRIAGGDCANVVELDQDTHVINCKVTGGTANGIDVGDRSVVMKCTVYDVAGKAIFAPGAFVAYNRVLSVTLLGALPTHGYWGLLGTTFYNNVYYGYQTNSGVGIATNGNAINIIGNTVYNVADSTSPGIDIGASDGSVVCMNNYVEGFSGAGGYGIIVRANAYVTLFANNYAYDNTTNFAEFGNITESTGNVELSESALYNASSTAMEPNALLKDKAWPGGVGQSDTEDVGYDSYVDVGALQREEGWRRGFIRNHGS